MSSLLPATAAPAADRSPWRVARQIGLALLVLVTPLAVPSLASAHAALDTISPADKSTGPSPTEIIGTFTEDLVPANSSFTVVDASSAIVTKGGEVSSDDPRRMTLVLTAPLAPGAYEIRWATKSAEDNETDRGITSFTVVADSPSSSVEQSIAPSLGPTEGASVAASPAPSAAPTTPVSSTSDALIPIVAVLILLAAAVAWLLRGRSRAGR